MHVLNDGETGRSTFSRVKTLVGAVMAALGLIGGYQVYEEARALPAKYRVLAQLTPEDLEAFRSVYKFLADALPETKGTDGKPLNRSAVLDALVKQAIRQAAQQPPAGTKPPTTPPPPPTPEKKE